MKKDMNIATNEPLIQYLQVIIHWSVRVLAILMVFVIVMATALMAIARKVIILDLEQTEPEYLWGIASIVIAISIGYWMVVKLPRTDLVFGPGKSELKRMKAAKDKNAQSKTAPSGKTKAE